MPADGFFSDKSSVRVNIITDTMKKPLIRTVRSSTCILMQRFYVCVFRLMNG